ALQMYEESMAIKERIGDELGKANTAGMLAQLLAYEQNDYERGLQLMNYAVAIYEHLKSVELEKAEEIRSQMFIDQIQYELGEEVLQAFMKVYEAEGPEKALQWLEEKRKQKGE
ncbi:MAG: hypothetical protein AAFO07_30455, partial [Bacteroidota bacterium]